MKDNKFEFASIERRTKVIPSVIERKVNGKEYIYWGNKNDFPEYLWQLYLKSAVLQAIVNGTTEFVAGNKIDVHESIKNLSKNANKTGESFEDIIQKITNDYFIFGGIAMQLIYNGRGEVNEIYWLDFQNVRSNEDGTKLFYCEDWKHSNMAEIQEYRAFDANNRRGTCIYYYKGNKSRGVYPIPLYIGALTAIETSTEISKFHLNNILNNLESSALISFNGGIPSSDEQEKIERKIKEKFSGAENAGKFIISFCDSRENAPTVARIAEDNFDKKFDALRTSTMQEIFVSWRAIPTLFGFTVNDTMFSHQEFTEAYTLYQRNMVYPTQKALVNIFDKIFGIENSIKFENYSLFLDPTDEAKENQNKEGENNE